MDRIDVNQAIDDLVSSPEFIQDFKDNLAKIRDPEKKVKIMDTLLGYQISKLKTSEPVAQDRFRPIQIVYSVAGEEKAIDNGENE